MSNMVPPEMADMLVEKVLEAVKSGKIKNVSLSVEMEGEGKGKEEDYKEEGEEECPECGEEMVVKGKNMFCPECGYEERLKPNPDKDVEGKGDVDTAKVRKEEYGNMENKRDAMMKDEMKRAFSNVDRLREYSKRK